MPCQDLQANRFDIHATESNPDHPQEDHSDYCSPFCVCECCSIPVSAEFTSAKVIVPNLNSFKNIPYTAYDNSYQSVYSSKVYQPPIA